MCQKIYGRLLSVVYQVVTVVWRVLRQRQMSRVPRFKTSGVDAFTTGNSSSGIKSLGFSAGGGLGPAQLETLFGDNFT